MQGLYKSKKKFCLKLIKAFLKKNPLKIFNSNNFRKEKFKCLFLIASISFSAAVKSLYSAVKIVLRSKRSKITDTHIQISLVLRKN